MPVTPPLTLYVASTNRGKLADFRAAAEAHSGVDAIAIAPLPNLEKIPAAPENEPTFAGNAISKAVYYSRDLPGEIVLADDSGLEVNALDGAPGVRSARYSVDAGNGSGKDEENNSLLIQNMLHVPKGQRGARYRCSLAAARDGQCLLTVDGTVEGEILTSPRGTGGFGYDPLFYLPGLGLTMAEIDLGTKHRLSHRGNAFRAMLAQLPLLTQRDGEPGN